MKGKLEPKIGKRIRAERKARGWTIPQLAEKAGIDEKTIGRTENEVSSPTLYTFCALCRALDLCADEVLGLRKFEANSEIITLMRKFEEHEIEAIKAFMKQMSHLHDDGK